MLRHQAAKSACHSCRQWRGGIVLAPGSGIAREFLP